MFFLHLPLATKQWHLALATKLGTSHWQPSLEHSIGNQTLDLPSPPFSFSLKGELKSLGGLSFPGHNFQFNLEYLFQQTS
jgi:hypothetical protein